MKKNRLLAALVAAAFIFSLLAFLRGNDVFLPDGTKVTIPNATDPQDTALLALSNAVNSLTSPVFNVKTYGAKGDTKTVWDVATTSSSAVITSATANFASSDVGKVIGVDLAGPTDSNSVRQILAGTIVSVQSTTQVTLSATASVSATGLACRWGTNDEAAIQAAIAAAYNAGGGVVYFPPGGYMVDGLQDSSTFNSMLEIPYIAEGGANVCIELCGAMEPPASYWVGLSAQTPPTSGLSIIHAVNAGVTNKAPAVIATNYIGAGFGNVFSMTALKIRNLLIRCPNNPKLVAVQSEGGGPLRMEHVSCDIDANGQNYQRPTTAKYNQTGTSNGSMGVWTPTVGNPNTTILNDVFVTGYGTGYRLNEHTEMGYCTAALCYVGYSLGAGGGASHSAHASTIRAWWCPYMFQNDDNGALLFNFDNVSVENSDSGSVFPTWSRTIYNYDDAQGACSGYIRGVLCTTAAVGSPVPFTKSSAWTNVEIYDNFAQSVRTRLDFATRLATVSSGGGTLTQYNGDYYLSTNANGDQLSWTFTCTNPGTYSVYLIGQRSTNLGKMDFQIDSNAAFSTGNDAYDTTNYHQDLSLGTVALTAGSHTLKMTVNGKNASSSSYGILNRQVTMILGAP